VIGDVAEETNLDLEAAASLMVSNAISMSDFVVVPMQGSQLDTKQEARQMKMIKAQERIAGSQAGQSHDECGATAGHAGRVCNICICLYRFNQPLSRWRLLRYQSFRFPIGQQPMKT
jgi:hypothetical protein